MKYGDSHISDQELLLDVDGELAPQDEKVVRKHLDACWNCRARRQELENTITDFVRIHHREGDAKLPDVAGRRALLKARLAQLPVAGSRPRWFDIRRFAWGLAAVPVLAALFIVVKPYESISRNMVVSTPDPRLTPGGALLQNRQAVCSQENAKNKAVPVALQKRVFEEYGIAGAEPRAYEVDYLVTPALGGVDDIRNLWPQSHSATVWNAEVKDALEDRLREMVCDGELDLADAQHEIAANWIAAYKKYFHTNVPLAEHGRQDIP